MLEYFTPESITGILEQMESDEEQTMEQLNYIDEFFKAMQDVDDKFDMLSEAQQVFAKRNDSYVKKDEVDLEEIYEETK
jgi:esterase/lipase